MATQQARLTAVFQRIAAEFKSIRSDLGGMKIRKVTAAQYLLIIPKDPNTIYVVDGVIKITP